MRQCASALFALALGLGGLGGARAATDIEWWHAMGGALGEKLNKIADDFNKSQSDYVVKPTFKGNYPEVLTAAIAGFRAKQAPHIVQVFEVGTATMMAAKGAVYPVYQLMQDTGAPFDPKAYLPTVVGYYTDPSGKLLSFPFNSSTPIFYYNKDAFRKAGLDADKPPQTWDQVVEAAKKLQGAGTGCGLATEWPSWIHLENLSAWHNKPFATKENGFAGLDTRLVFDADLQERHWANLAEWQRTKLFSYGGRGPDGKTRFYSGECGMLTASSAARADVLANSKFDVGFGMLPYYQDVQGAPQNTIIGGATLWVLKGKPQAEYKGVAAFFAYLSKPEVQAWWHQNTGYLPITQAAYELSKSQGYYDKNPGAEISIKQMTLHPPTENSKGLRLGSFVQIRNIIEEELEQALAGKKPAADALKAAQERGNELLKQFQQANM